jgi:hypothetical protein
MNYNLYLKYKEEEWLNIQHEDSDVLDGIAASIMYDTYDDIDNGEEDLSESMKIGFVTFLTYNQVLAMTYGINMNDVPMISLRRDSKIFKELDCAFISQETIDEIGGSGNLKTIIIFSLQCR